MDHDLLCPIIPAINPEYERARRDSAAWLVEHGLLCDASASSRFDAIGVAEFVARAYPDARYESLRLVLDWTAWGFLADDQHDVFVTRPGLVQARYSAFADLLAQGGSAMDGMQRALLDLRARVLAFGDQGCLRRFAGAVREWFASMSAEVRNRARHTPPALAAYVRLREITVGMYTEYALFDATHRVRTDDAFWLEPDVRYLMSMTANLIAWVNDIFSCHKERAAGDPHNLVLLLAAERRLSEREAVARVVELHNREMTRFLELESSVRRDNWVAPALMEPFLALLRAWIRGNLDWARASQRYAR